MLCRAVLPCVSLLPAVTCAQLVCALPALCCCAVLCCGLLWCGVAHSPSEPSYSYQPHPVFDFYHTPFLRSLLGLGPTHSTRVRWRRDTVAVQLAGVRLVDSRYAQLHAEQLLTHRPVTVRLMQQPNPPNGTAGRCCCAVLLHLI